MVNGLLELSQVLEGQRSRSSIDTMNMESWPRMTSLETNPLCAALSLRNLRAALAVTRYASCLRGLLPSIMALPFLLASVVDLTDIGLLWNETCFTLVSTPCTWGWGTRKVGLLVILLFCTLNTAQCSSGIGILSPTTDVMDGDTDVSEGWLVMWKA